MEAAWIIFIICSILSSLGFLLTVSVFIFTVRFIKLRFIKMTSPRINMVLFSGVTLMYINSILLVLPMDSWTIQMKTMLVQCRYWLMALSFTATYGTMLVKGWRVQRLFQYPRVHAVTIRDGSLFGGIMVLVLLDLGLLTSWQTIDPITCSEDTYSHCSSDYYSIWMSVLLLYKYAIIFMCCYIGWQVRHISFPALDDSRCLLLCSGVMLTLFGTACLVFLLFPTNNLVLYTSTSIFNWIAATAVLFIIFLPKVMVVYKSRGLEPLMGSASQYVQQPVSNDVGIELVKILAENRYLKKQIEERDVLVGQLKKRVGSSTSTDCESQQTNATANYSLTSSSPSVSFCCLNCLSPPDINQRPLKPDKTLPIVSDADGLKTVDVLTLPALQEESSDIYMTLGMCHCHQKGGVVPQVTVSPTEPVDLTIGVAQTEHQVVCEGEIQSTENIHVAQAKACNSNDLYLNDVDLLVSIADTYDLGDDSDALSYISNCLHGSNRRRLAGKAQTLGMPSTLGSDQLYPEYMTCGMQKAKKHHRRRSIATAGNIYVNEKGNPLIV